MNLENEYCIRDCIWCGKPGSFNFCSEKCKSTYDKHQEELKKLAMPELERKCHCDINLLLQAGCKCGGK